MNMFFREIKRNYISFLVWLLINLFMSSYIFIIYPSFKDDIAELLKIKFPPAMQKAFGINIENSTNILNFFSIMVPFLLLIGAIYASMLFGAIISKEENDKTIEFLLSKPVSRSGIATSKLFAGFLFVTLFTAITWGLSFILFEVTKYSDYDKFALLLMGLGQYFGILYFCALSFLISTFVYRSRNVIPISVALVLGGFLLQTMASFASKAEFFKYLTPFEFFKPEDLMTNRTFNKTYLVINFAVILVCLVAGYIRYNKKDMLA